MISRRQYQQKGIEGVLAEARRGAKNTVVCSPVGSGKSVMISELCRMARRPVVISPSLTLLDQLHRNLCKWLDEPVDVEQGLRKAEYVIGLKRRVVVASKASLLSRGRYKGRAFEGTSLVLVDECHIGMTPPMISILRHFEESGAFVCGFSATPYKGKGRPLPYWNRPCFSYSLLDAIKDGWLVRPQVHLSEAKSIDLRLVEEVAHEWDKAQLEAVLTAEHAVQEIASLVLQTSRSQPSAVYCHSVRQASLVAEVLRRYGRKVSLVHSKQSAEDRQANMDAFTSGEAKIICNVNVLAYGWDFPELRNIYNAAPTQSIAVYEQRIGRGTRALPGVLSNEMSLKERLDAIAASAKPSFNIYDITDCSRAIQLVNALDVLDAASRDNVERRRRMMEKMESGVDVLEEAVAQDEIDNERRLLEAQELKEKRQKLIVGMTFGHEDRDPFAPPVESRKQRGWRMLWGPYRGQLIRDLPEGYLKAVHGKAKKDSPLIRAIGSEIANRNRSDKQGARS